MAILPNLQQQNEELLAQVAALKAKLEAKATTKLTLKVSEKGACSLYGLGRWPVTLYKSQWRALLNHTKTIGIFLDDNDHLLKAKED